MAWAFERAVKRGTVVTVRLKEAESGEVIDMPYEKAFAGQTAAQFKTMVKREIAAHLAELNATEAEQDVSGDYTP
jgi:hypothetical protein